MNDETFTTRFSSKCSVKLGKCFVGHEKSYRVYPRRRVLVRDGYLQADTEHCFRAGGHRTSGDGLRTDLGGAANDDPITQLVAEKIIAIGRLGIEDPAEISQLALKELGLP